MHFTHPLFFSDIQVAHFTPARTIAKAASLQPA
jgi:hypothetical protein